MAEVSGMGTTWGLPNYTGELFTADQISAPFLSKIGGLNGGKTTQNFQFPTASLYDFTAAAQPAITETASLTAPTATEVVRTQEFNVTQIFHKAVSVSYEKMSNGGRLSGLNTVGSGNNVQDELAFQTKQKLVEVARDVNYTFLNGTYQIATDAGVANKTRGIYEVCSTGNTLAAAGAKLTKAMIDSILKTMFDNGARFNNVWLWCNSFNRNVLTSLYTFLPQDRTIGGSSIEEFITDFGRIKIAIDRDNPAASVGFFDLSVIAPVFQPVPNKGNFFLEPLAKTGASDNYQLFGKIGLDYGAKFMHGSITGTAVA